MSEVERYWHNLSSAKKMVLFVLILVALAAPVAIALMMHERNFVVLYQDLSEEDAARLIEKLNSLKIEYELDQSGQTVLVDKALADDVRLQLVGGGVKPGAGVGYEIFDTLSYGVSDFAQKIHYLRAVQGELARTISALEEVRSTRVHIVLPEEKLFDKTASVAKASVILTLEKNRSLTESQIEGIRQLVSSSVKGLAVSDVVISNDHGVLLTTANQGPHNQATALLGDKEKIERDLVAKCESILSHVFGAGNAVVNVNVTLALSEVNETRETILPVNPKSDSGVLVQRKHSVTRKSGTESDAGQTKSNHTQETSEDVYETGKLVESKVKKPGEIVRVSLSALVPKDTTDEQLASVRKLLSATVGIDSNRGDLLAVERLPFYQAVDGAVKGEERILSPSMETPLDSSASDIRGIDWLLKNRFVLMGIFVFITALCLALLFRRSRGYALESSEKEQLLLEIRGWLNEDRRLPETRV